MVEIFEHWLLRKCCSHISKQFLLCVTAALNPCYCMINSCSAKWFNMASGFNSCQFLLGTVNFKQLLNDQSHIKTLLNGVVSLYSIILPPNKSPIPSTKPRTYGLVQRSLPPVRIWLPRLWIGSRFAKASTVENLGKPCCCSSTCACSSPSLQQPGRSAHRAHSASHPSAAS